MLCTAHGWGSCCRQAAKKAALQAHPTTSSPKGARALAQIAWMKGIEAQKASGGLGENDQFSTFPSALAVAILPR